MRIPTDRQLLTSSDSYATELCPTAARVAAAAQDSALSDSMGDVFERL